MEELEQGLEIQESSQELMSSMIKDLLDYAQIRAGKFRKNITTFDIRKSIEKVMAIQRLNVKSKGLDFEVEYLNLSQDEFIIPEGKFSPIINCDEQRIM